jgi:hypothetical protein
MAGKLQNEDFKTEVELTGAGGSKDQLLNDTKIYITGNSINKTLDDAVIDGDMAKLLYGSFSAANNQASPADVTGLTLSGRRGGDLSISVAIDATADLYATFKLLAIEKSGSWELQQEYVGDDTNINFTITAGGQIQYTSGNEAGFVSSTITWDGSWIEV